MATTTQHWYVTFADARGKLCSVWLQLNDSSEFSQVNELMINIDTRFADLVARETNKSFFVGELCIAKYSEDDKCYRARVVRPSVSTSSGIPGVQVAFIDYGNVEIVAINSIIRASSDMFTIPPLATMYYLADFQPANKEMWTLKELDKLRLNLLDTEVVGELINSGRPGMAGTMRLYDAKTRQLLVDSLIRAGTGTRYDNAHLKLPTYKSIQLKLGASYPVVLCNFESPFNFWVQILENRSQYDAFIASLQQVPSMLMNEHDMNIGKMCVARYEKPAGGSTMCRAVIANVFKDQNRCSLYFVDFGVTVDCLFNSIFVIPEIFASVPAMAVNCMLTPMEAASTPLQQVFTTNNIFVVAQSEGIYLVSKTPPSQSLPTNSQPVHSAQTVRTDSVPGLAPQQQQRVDSSAALPSMAPASLTLTSNTVVDGAKPGGVQLNLGEIYDIQVVNVEDTGLFFCHLTSTVEKFGMVKQHLLTIRLTQLNPPYLPGAHCIVKRSSDGLPCRAQIASVAGGSIHVRLVDFGNVENAALGAIFRSSDDLICIPSFAVCCCLAGAADIPLPSLVKLLRKYEEKGGICARFIVKKEGPIYEVEVFDSISRVVTLIEDGPKDQQDNQPKRTKPAPAISPIAPTQSSAAAAHLSPKAVTPKQSDALVTIGLDNGRKENLYITTIYSGTEFFGQLSCYSDELLTNMQDELNAFYRNTRGRVLQRPNVGDLCITTFSGDENYYRARILKIEGRNAQVMFIDYGNIEDKPLQSLYILDSKFCRLPIQGIRCKLLSSKAPQDKLYETLLDTNIMVMVEGRDGDAYEVSTPQCAENVAINKLLQSYRAAANVQPAVTELSYVKLVSGKREKVAVTYVQDPEHVYVQPLSSSIQLETLMTNINTHCVRKPAALGERPKLGMLVLAKYPEDDRWYRGIIRGLKKGDKIEVQFLDYGNFSDVPLAAVQMIMPEFLQLPGQALCCSLVGVQQSVAWSSEETDLLFGLLQDDAYYVFTAASAPQGDSWPVEIIDHNGRNINQLFGQQTNKMARPTAKMATPPRAGKGDTDGNRQQQRFDRSARGSDSERMVENGGFDSSKQAGGFQRNGDGYQRRNEGEFFNKQEGGGFQRRDGESGFKPREGRINQREGGGNFGQKEGGSSFGQRESGGFGGQRESGGFGGQRESGGFGGQRESGGFGGQRESGGFGQRDSGGFGQREGGSFGQREGSGFGQREGFSGGSRRDDSNFQRRDEGGFQKRDNNEGRYQRRDNDGGFQKREGFQNRGVESGPSQNREERGGFQKRDRDDDGGFKKREGGGFGERGPRNDGGFGQKGERAPRVDQPAGGRQGGFGSDNRQGFGSDNKQGFGGRTNQRIDNGFGNRPASTSNDNWGEDNSSSVVSSTSIKAASLRTGETVNVYVAFIVSPSQFWCQTTAGSTPLEKFIAEMRSELTNKPGDFSAPAAVAVGDYCYSVFSEDSQWYRAKIVAITGDSAEVLFVDYGNSESVPVAQLKKLLPKHSQFPAQAFKCELEKVGPVEGSDWSTEAIAKFEELVMEQELKCNIVRISGDSYGVELHNADINVHEQLVSSGYAKIVVKTTAKAQESKTAEQTGGDMKVGHFCDVSVVYISTPESFACQLIKHSKELNTLMERLREAYNAESGEVPVQVWKVGDMCCCKYSVDNEWYRAKVLETAEDKVKVYFVDYGNDEWADSQNVRPLQAEFLVLPPVAVTCAMANIKPIGAEWSEEAVSVLEELTIDKQLVAQVLASDVSGKFSVSLVEVGAAGKVDIGNEMVKRNVAQHDKPTPVPVQTSKTQRDRPAAAAAAAVYVNQMSNLSGIKLNKGQEYHMVSSWTCTVNEFYLQLKHHEAALSALAGQMCARYSSLKATELAASSVHVGQVCAAKFAVDGGWYRAVVVAVNGTSVRVFYLDYGNTETVQSTELKLLESQFAQLPMQAVKCALNLDNFGTVSLPKMKSLLAKAPLKCTVLFEKDGTYFVDVTNSAGASVVDTLKSCASTSSSKATAKKYAVSRFLFQSREYNVTVSYVEGCDALWCQLNDASEQLESVMAVMESVYRSSNADASLPEVGMPCAAIYDVDNAWYRAQLLSIDGDNCKVHFVDYGNTQTVSKNNIRLLSAELASPAPLAYRCALRGVPVHVVNDSVKGIIEGVVNELSVTITVHETLPSLTLVSMKIADADLTGNVLAALGKDIKLNESIAYALKPNKEDTVTVSHYNSVRDFYVQPNAKLDDIEAFAEALQQAEYDGEGVLTKDDLVMGGYVCAKYTEDGRWYRAVVMAGGDNESCVVKFIDYGNSEAVSCAELRQLKEAQCTDAAWAVQCTLMGVPEDAVLDDDNIRDVLEGKEVKVDSISDTYPCIVSLLSDGKDVAACLNVSKTAAVVNIEKPVIKQCTFSADVRSTVSVSYIVSMRNLYVQLADRNDALYTLTDIIQTEAEQLPSGNFAQGDYCIAQYSSDAAWYRAVIEAIDSDTATVRFVDFGNTDTLPLNALRPLTHELAEEAAFAIECVLDGVTVDSSDEYLAAVRELLDDKEAVAEFLTNTIPYQVKLWQGEDLLNSKVTEIAVGKPKQVDNIVTYLNVSPVSLALSSRSEVYVSFTETPGRFWIQQCNQFELLRQQQENLQTLCLTNAVNVGTVEVGAVYIGQCTDDNEWYRCRVKSISDDGVFVQYIDYGNSEMLSVGQLRGLPSRFAGLPAQAVECSLADVVPAGSDWIDETYDFFVMLTTERTLLAIVVDCSDKGVYKIKLLDMGISVSESLVEAGLAKSVVESELDTSLADSTKTSLASSTPRLKKRRLSFQQPALTVGCTVDVRVTSCLSPNNFWCCTVNESADLTELLDELTAYCNEAPSLSAVRVGSVCAARCSQDSLYYRSVVTDVIDGGEATVCFVDSGNTETVDVTSLKVLPDTFISRLPMQAFRCRLAGVMPAVREDGWDAGACTRLEELLVYDESKTFTAHIVSVTKHQCGPMGIHASVSLMDGEQSIAEVLIGGGYAQAQSEIENEVRDYIDEIVAQAIGITDEDKLEGMKEFIAEVSDDEEELYSTECVQGAMHKAAASVAGSSSPALKEGDTFRGYYIGTGTPDNFTIGLSDNTELPLPPSSGIVPDGPQITCMLDVGPHKWSLEDIASFESLCKDQLLQVEVVGIGTGKLHIVKLRTNDSEKTVNELVEEQCMSSSLIGDSTVTADTVNTEASFLEVSINRASSVGELPVDQDIEDSDYKVYRRLKLRTGDEMDVRVLSLVNPDNLVVMPMSLSAEYDELISQLNDKYSDGDMASHAELVEPQKGQPCSVYIRDEQTWYRGEIVDLHPEGQLMVSLVDRAVIKTVSLSSVRLLYPVFLSQPALAISCSLAHLQPVGITWNPELIDVMQVFCLASDTVKPTLKMTVIDFDEENRPLVALAKNGIDLASTLQHYNIDDEVVDSHEEHDRSLSMVRQEGLDDQDMPVKQLPAHQLIVNSVYDALMTHIVSPGDIWCQVQSEQLEQLMEQLQVWCEETKAIADTIPVLTEGEACCARSSVNNVWYRAKVSVADGVRYTVRFVDYGHEEVLHADNLLPLPAVFAQDPPFAVACSLYGIKPTSGADWTEDATVTLEENVSVPFRMRVRSIGNDRVEVDMITRDGDNLADQLLSKSQSGIVRVDSTPHGVDEDARSGPLESSTSVGSSLMTSGSEVALPQDEDSGQTHAIVNEDNVREESAESSDKQSTGVEHEEEISAQVPVVISEDHVKEECEQSSDNHTRVGEHEEVKFDNGAELSSEEAEKNPNVHSEGAVPSTTGDQH